MQIVNTSNIKTAQEPRLSRHIINNCLINYVSSENQNEVLSNKQFNSRVDRKFNKSVFNPTWKILINLKEQ